MVSLFDSCATEKEVKNKYRALAKIMHPDKGGNSTQFAAMQDQYEAALKRINEKSSNTNSRTDDFLKKAWEKVNKAKEEQRKAEAAEEAERDYWFEGNIFGSFGTFNGYARTGGRQTGRTWRTKLDQRDILNAKVIINLVDTWQKLMPRPDYLWLEGKVYEANVNGSIFTKKDIRILATILDKNERFVDRFYNDLPNK